MRLLLVWLINAVALHSAALSDVVDPGRLVRDRADRGAGARPHQHLHPAGAGAAHAARRPC